jgi:hypothetical protein
MGGIVSGSIGLLFSQWINNDDSEFFTFTPQMIYEVFKNSPHMSLNKCKYCLLKEPKFIKKYKLVDGTIDTYTPKIYVSREEFKKKYAAWRKKVWGD